MALAGELFDTPASRLDSFVAQWLLPSREWRAKMKKVVRTVERFLKEEDSQAEHLLGQKVRVLKVIQADSFGKGTALRNAAEVELVVFLSCFHSFREEAKFHQAVLSLIQKKLWRRQDLLALGLKDVYVAQGVPDALVVTIQPSEISELVTVTIVPAYRALGPLVPNFRPPPEVYESLIKAHCYPGIFSPSFRELQTDFVKHRPTKLKNLLRLVKHWYLQAHHPGSG
ncbi:2'-5'-oligoadenylate synthase-like protein isoform X3 [Tenrec ecaudatus]|uniref:2'-5'-oligoadenylate synthase-like protein isoform X3 n=1 Tax=Tenrec ecaudatus TaxID=94439 RepID=UPI003F5ABC53